MKFNYDSVIYILGGSDYCFVILNLNEVIRVKASLDELYEEVKNFDFERINMFTIVNTKYIIGFDSKRRIILRGGCIHRVSRKKWNAVENSSNPHKSKGDEFHH
jgi:DNA-binding LytR/AlgR family response regulator